VGLVGGPLPHSAKAWKNDPDTGVAPMGTDTPVDAAGLFDLENRVSDSIDASLEEHGAPLAYTVSGALGVGPRSIPIPITRSGKLTAGIGASPLAGRVVADINLNGTSIFSDQGNRPTIMAGETTSGVTVPDVQDVVAGDVLTVDIDEVGSAAIEFVAALTGTGTGASRTATRPGTAAAGDLILASCRGPYVSSAPITVTPPAGWTEIGTRVDGAAGAHSIQRFWKFDAGEATHTFTWSATPGTSPGLACTWLRNALPGTPIDNTTAGAAAFGSGLTLPSLSVAEESEFVVATAQFQTGRTLTTPPPGMDLRFPASAETSANQLVFTDQLPFTLDPTGARAMSFSGSDHRLYALTTVRRDPSAVAVEKGSDLVVTIGLG
jgi:hypothetical protein